MKALFFPCTTVHPERFTVMSTWMMRRKPQNNGASALTTHQLWVERVRESDRANSVDGDYFNIILSHNVWFHFPVKRL